MLKYEFLQQTITELNNANSSIPNIIDLSRLFHPFQFICNLIWAQAIEFKKPIYKFKLMIEILEENEVMEQQLERHGIQAIGISIREGRISSKNLFLEEAKAREFEFHFPIFRMHVQPLDNDEKLDKGLDIGIHFQYESTFNSKVRIENNYQQNYHDVKIKLDNPWET